MIRRTAVLIAVLLGGMGLIVSRPQLLQWLNQQNPVVDFLVWYALLFVYIQFASFILFKHLDMTMFRYGLGAVVLFFAAGIVFYWPASTYALNIVGAAPASSTGTPPFLVSSEDQVTYEFWHFLLPWLSNDAMGFLIYVITPVVLVLAVALFLAPKQLTAATRGLLRPL